MQRGTPEKESPGIFIPKGDPSWRKKEINSKVPSGQFLRSVQFLCRNYPAGAKMSRWHLGIISFWRQLEFLLELSRWHLENNSVWR